MTGAERTPRRVLDTPITFLKGVGERRAEGFRRLGVLSARDLLFHIPHRYEDASTVRRISSLRIGENATVIGTVISKGVLPTRKGLRVFQAVVQDASGLIERSGSLRSELFERGWRALGDLVRRMSAASLD